MVKKMVTISGMYDFEEVVPISVYQKDGTAFAQAHSGQAW